MSDDMAKAIFHRDFHFTSRTRNAGWAAYAGERPQSFPREFIDAAVAAGVAEIVPPKRKKQPAETPDETDG